MLTRASASPVPRSAAAPLSLLELPDDVLFAAIANLPPPDWIALFRVCTKLADLVLTWRVNLGLRWPCIQVRGETTLLLRSGRELTEDEASAMQGRDVERCTFLFTEADALELGGLPQVCLDESQLVSIRRLAIRACPLACRSHAQLGILRLLHEMVEVHGPCSLCHATAHESCAECGMLTCSEHLDDEADDCFGCSARICAACSLVAPGFPEGEGHPYKCFVCRLGFFRAASSAL